MQFLNPLFLIGAAAIAIPIALHLFRKEKTKSLAFASLMFLRRLPTKETRRRRLRYLLLLALRCLAWLLIAAAFARPVLTSQWLAQINPLAARSTVILVDRSMSVAQTSLWAGAVDAARDKINAMGESDEAILIQFGETVDTISRWESSPNRLLEAVNTRLKPSFEATSYVEGLRLAAEQLKEAQNSRKEIYLISDLQREGLSSEIGWKAPPDVTVEIRNLSAFQENLFIRQVRLEREVFAKEYPHPILVQLGTSPPRAVKGVVELYVEGVLKDRQSFETGENGNALVQLKPFELEEGVTKGRVVVDHPDAIAADNLYHFVLERRAPRRVLLVSSRTRDLVYLESALSAGENLPYEVETVQRLSGSYDPAQTPLILINDLAKPPPAATIQDFLAKGGGVIVVLGNSVRPDAYNRDWARIMPATLKERNFVRKGGQSFTSMTEIGWEHPVFSVFQDLYRPTLSSTQFYGYWTLEPKPEATVLARFSKKDPALIESTIEEGRLVVFASSVGLAWTDFPLRSAFVPFWQATAQYVTGWQNRPAAAGINQAMGLEEWTGGDDSSGRISILDPNGARVLGLDGDQPDFIRLAVPGYYEIRSNKKTNWVAVNPPSFESDLDSVPLEDFLAAFIPQRSRQGEIDAPEAVVREERRQALWWPFLAAAALLLALEAWVANRTTVRRPIAVAPNA